MYFYQQRYNRLKYTVLNFTILWKLCYSLQTVLIGKFNMWALVKLFLDLNSEITLQDDVVNETYFAHGEIIIIYVQTLKIN